MFVSVFAVGENNKRLNITYDTYNRNQANHFMKAIWVSYITLDMQNTDKSEQAFINKVTKIIKTTKDSGFDTLIFQVRPFCDALYESKYFPWSHILTGEQGLQPEYDPLKIICDLCHKNNISVHAWINPYRVKTNGTPKKLDESNPYITDTTLGFEHNGNTYLDPSNEEAQNLIVDGIIEIIENYDIDGIQFDDYFYPENSNDIDNEKYIKYASGSENPLSKENWRAENVNKLIKKVYESIHDKTDNVIFGISPQGNINNNISLGADVKKWCEQEGYIDYICPQIYFSLDNPSLNFEDCMEQWLKIRKHKKLKLYIGLAAYKGGTNDDEGTWLDNNDILKTEIEICESKETDGIMLYSYESFYNEENKEEIQNAINHVKGITQ